MMTLVVVFCLVAGGIFGLVGSIGLVRLPTPMMRLHAPTKATTLGVGGVLVAALLRGWAVDEAVPHAVLITAFLFLTAPVSAMFLARLRVRARPRTLPSPGEGARWSADEPH